MRICETYLWLFCISKYFKINIVSVSFLALRHPGICSTPSRFRPVNGSGSIYRYVRKALPAFQKSTGLCLFFFPTRLCLFFLHCKSLAASFRRWVVAEQKTRWKQGIIASCCAQMFRSCWLLNTTSLTLLRSWQPIVTSCATWRKRRVASTSNHWGKELCMPLKSNEVRQRWSLSAFRRRSGCAWRKAGMPFPGRGLPLLSCLLWKFFKEQFPRPRSPRRKRLVKVELGRRH